MRIVYHFGPVIQGNDKNVGNKPVCTPHSCRNTVAQATEELSEVVDDGGLEFPDTWIEIKLSC